MFFERMRLGGMVSARAFLFFTHSKDAVMKTQTIHGLSLIAGSLGCVVTMLIHPTGMGSLASVGEVMHETQFNMGIHILGLLSLPFVLFGFAGVSQRAGWDRPASQFALVVYLLSAVAIMFAAIASGILGPVLMQSMIGATKEVQQGLETALAYNYQLNQACAKVFVVGASLAIVSWSFAIAHLGRIERAISRFGWLVGAVVLAAFVSGHIHVDVHGFGIIIFLQSAWAIALGAAMIRLRPATESTAVFA
jgi:hypothetical protein